MDVNLKSVAILFCFLLFVFISKKFIQSLKARKHLNEGEETTYKGRNVFEQNALGEEFDPDKVGYSEDASFNTENGPPNK